MRSYGKGFHPSPDDARDWPLHKLGARLLAFPDYVDNDHTIEQIYNQFGLSCTGWAAARAWHVRARLQGDVTAPFPSGPLIYTEGRAADAGTADAPLVDDGCTLRLVLQAETELGVVPLDRWNGPALQSIRPDWETLREAADMRGVSYARVYGVDEMRVALASGYPLLVGFQVDRSFEDYRSGVWDGMKGPPLGGHATCFTGYKIGSFRGVNQWDYDWGEQGMYWISDRAADGIEAWAIELVAPSS